MRLGNIEASRDGHHRSFSIMQWSLFAACLFFCSGHWYDASFHGLIFKVMFIICFQRMCVAINFTIFLVLHSVDLFSGVLLMVSAMVLHL